VDFRSDTPAKVDDYAKYFIPEAVGLTGTKTEIDRVVSRYGTSYSIEETKTSALGYSVQHSTDFYFIDQDGRLIEQLPTEAPREQLIALMKSI